MPLPPLAETLLPLQVFPSVGCFRDLMRQWMHAVHDKLCSISLHWGSCLHSNVGQEYRAKHRSPKDVEFPYMSQVMGFGLRAWSLRGFELPDVSHGSET